MPLLKISPQVARRFLLRSHGFIQPFANVAAVLDHHGYIQIDPINVCGRMHDLILRNRVADYAEGDLMRYLHGWSGASPRRVSEPAPRDASLHLGPEHRTAFEHHLPHSSVLVAFPLEAWPHLDAAMQARTRQISAWSGRLTPREKELAPRLLAEIAARGPLGSAEFDDPRSGRRVWGKSTLVKSVLQKLFFHGRLLLATRVNNHRRYDLPERVLPRAVLAQKPASKEETERWIAILKVRQYRLALLKKTEVAAAGDAIAPVDIEGCPRVWCLAEDVADLAGSETRRAFRPKALAAVRLRSGPERGRGAFATQPAATRHPASGIRLLAPLDPIIYQRKLTSALWHFDYTWEVYTPPAKRVRGYYALPILAGDQLVGHVDPKADRESRRLRIVSRKVRRGHRASQATVELARFLKLRP